MLSGLSTSMLLPTVQALLKSDGLTQAAGKVPAAAGYALHATQDVQKLIAAASNTFSEVLKISTVLQGYLAGSAVPEEKGQQTPAKGEVRTAQQQPMGAKASSFATIASSKNEVSLQLAIQSKNSQKVSGNENEALKQIRGQEYIADRETSDTTLDDDQCALASQKNGSEDSANQQRRSKTFQTEAELKKIMNGQNETSLSLMSYSATSQLLSEEAGQQMTFSTTGHELILNDSRRYKVNPSNNQYSLERISSYSVNSSPSTSFSEGNTIGWLMHVFEEIRDAALGVIRLLGQTAQDSAAKVKLLTKASQDIKNALKHLENGSKDWEWGTPGPDGKIEPKEEYKKMFQTMQELGFKVDGLDVLEWLELRSKELTPPTTDVDWQSHLSTAHGYNKLPSGAEAMTLAVHKRAANCTCKDTDIAAAEGRPGWISFADLSKLSQDLDTAVIEQQDANTKLEQRIGYQNQLYQGFQTAIINTGLIIAELMKMAFSKMAI